MTGDGREPAGPRAAADEIRVLVVDDHPMVRTALAEMFDGEDDVTVVGQCEDGSQVVEATARLSPDVVCMDMSMPNMNGLAATEALRAARADVRIIMLTGGLAARPAIAAAGADALVPKSARAAALLRCLRTVAGGGTGCPYCLSHDRVDHDRSRTPGRPGRALGSQER